VSRCCRALVLALQPLRIWCDLLLRAGLAIKGALEGHTTQSWASSSGRANHVRALQVAGILREENRRDDRARVAPRLCGRGEGGAASATRICSLLLAPLADVGTAPAKNAPARIIQRLEERCRYTANRAGFRQPCGTTRCRLASMDALVPEAQIPVGRWDKATYVSKTRRARASHSVSTRKAGR